MFEKHERGEWKRVREAVWQMAEAGVAVALAAPRELG